jgi:deoxyribonuclease V
MHEWNVTVPEATAIQKSLREHIRLTPLKKKIRTIAGADISFNRFSDIFFAGIIVLSYPNLEEIEHALVRLQVSFPYVPGYLSFREVPALAQAYEQLKVKPDLIMMDGHGYAHPRRLGVATHLGLDLDTPTIGCAKTRLFGEGALPAEKKASTSPLCDPKTGEQIGSYVRTKDRVAPVIISPGHLITLEQSVDIALSTVRSYRLPEPTRRAHELVNAFRRGELLATA